MLLEAATAVWMVIERPPGIGPAVAWAGLLLLASIWLATAVLAVPRHEALRRGFDPGVLSALVASNWVRTAAWTLRSGLLLLVLHAVLA